MFLVLVIRINIGPRPRQKSVPPGTYFLTKTKIWTPLVLLFIFFATVDYNYRGESCKQNVLNETEHSQLLSSSVALCNSQSGLWQTRLLCLEKEGAGSQDYLSLQFAKTSSLSATQYNVACIKLTSLEDKSDLLSLVHHNDHANSILSN